jgi:hypothetical protein
MNCKRVREVFDPGLFMPADLIEHLERCKGCRAYADDVRRLQALLLSVPPVPVPDDFDLGLSIKLAAAETRPPLWRQATLRQSFALAASLLIMLTLGLIYYQRSTLLSEDTQQIATTAPSAEPQTPKLEPSSERLSEATAPATDSTQPGANQFSQPAPLSNTLAQSVSVTGGRTAARMTPARQIMADPGVVLLIRDEENQEERVITLPPVVFGSRPFVSASSKLVASAEKRGVL